MSSEALPAQVVPSCFDDLYHTDEFSLDPQKLSSIEPTFVPYAEGEKPTVKAEPLDCLYGGVEHYSQPQGDSFPPLYRDMIMQLVAKDIQNTSDRLGIAQDPRHWNPTQVRAWVLETIKQQQLPMTDLDRFNGLNGHLLVQMNMTEFNQRAPECGEKLFTCLQIWMAAPLIARDHVDGRMDSTRIGQDWPGAAFSGCEDLGNFGPAANVYRLSPLRILPPSAEQLQPAAQSSPISSGSDDSGVMADLEEIIERDMAARTPRTQPPTTSTHIHLWQFIRELLDNQDRYGYCVRWLSREQGIFKIEDSVRMAKHWGARKNRPAMNYDKLSRSLRQYYKKGILQKTPRSQRLVYQFRPPFYY